VKVSNFPSTTEFAVKSGAWVRGITRPTGEVHDAALTVGIAALAQAERQSGTSKRSIGYDVERSTWRENLTT